MEFTHGLTTKDLPMYPSNMKELCLYVKQARRIDGKKSYPQQRKFVHSKMWSQTHKKFDVKQLKLINKS